MKLRLLLIAILFTGLTTKNFADGFISYKLPLIPLEFIFNENGVHWEASKTIVTPLGSFALGYTEYNKEKYEEDYTYVIIEDMNLKKEHIYKINDKKTLNLISEGRTEIKITKNRVKIILDKGSQFKVAFSVEGKGTSIPQNKNWHQLDHYSVKGGLAKDLDTGLVWMRCSIGQKWTGSSCSGKVLEATWDKAMNIPQFFEYAGHSDWRVPTREELLSLRYCSSRGIKILENGKSHCKRYEEVEGPTIVQTVFVETGKDAVVWSSSEYDSRWGWGVRFSNGFDYTYHKSIHNQVRLVRSGH